MAAFSKRREVARIAPAALTIAFLLLGSTTALAQSIPGAAPIFNPQDPNAVNPANQAFTPTGPSLTIGAPSAGALTYSQMWNGAGLWLTTVDGTVTVSGSIYTVSVGFSAESFSLSGSTYTSQQGTGATLSFNSGAHTYTYTDHNGAIYTFQGLYTSGGAATYPYILTSIAHPNGEVDTFTYASGSYTISGVVHGVVRLQSVNNNFGYQLQIQYSTNTLNSNGSNLSTWLSRTVITGINNAIDYCAPSAVSCSGFSTTWPKLTYQVMTPGSTQTVTDAMSRVLTYTYDTSSRLTAIKLPSGLTESITYVSGANAVSTVSNGTGTWGYVFDGISTTYVTDPLANQTAYVVTSAGLVSSITDALQRATSLGYDAFNRLTQITYPEGDEVQYTYDSETAGVTRGNIVTVTRVGKPGSGLTSTTTTYGFDSTCVYPAKCNQPNSITDANSHTTNYTYDDTYGVVTKIDPPAPATGANAPETRLIYTPTAATVKNSGGTYSAASPSIDIPISTSECQTGTAPSCVGTSDEVKISLSYAGYGSGVGNNLAPTSATATSGTGSPTATSSVSYSDFGDVATAIGPLGSGQTAAYFYNADRQPTGLFGPNPGGTEGLPYPARKNTYNNDGLLTETEVGTDTSQTDSGFSTFTSANQTVMTPDSLDRPSKVTYSGGGTTYNLTQYSYDNANRLTCSAVRMNPSAFGSLPASACTLGTEGPNGNDRIDAYTYDHANELTQITVGSGTATQASSITQTYTNDGSVATVADADNNLTTYAYDGFNRLSQTTYPSKTQSAGSSDSTDYEAYTYDNADNVLTARKRTGDTVTLTYDNLNRVTEKAVPSWSGSNVFYTYNLFDQLKTADYTSLTGTPSVAYTYDALGRTTGETTTSAAGSFTVSSEYDAAGDRTRITWPDSWYASYTFDNLMRPTQVTGSGSVGTLATYTYNGVGDLTAIARGNGASTSLSYDSANRLYTLGHGFANTSADVTWTYGYDASNGLISRSSTNSAYTSHPSTQTLYYSTNGLNQYASVSGTSYSYDGRGNLASDGARSFTFDVDNKLLTGSSPTSATFTYDPVDRTLTDASGGATTTFLYDGANLSAEYSSAGAVLRRYVPSGLRADQPLVWYEGSAESTPRYLHADNQGSIAAYSDASGDEDAIYGYDPFGYPDATSGWAGSRYRYTGQLMIPENDLYNYKARSYDPHLGRFLQTDPTGYASDLNAYAYVGNGPTNATDPSGMAENPVTQCTGDNCGTPTASGVTVNAGGGPPGGLGGVWSPSTGGSGSPPEGPTEPEIVVHGHRPHPSALAQPVRLVQPGDLAQLSRLPSVPCPVSQSDYHAGSPLGRVTLPAIAKGSHVLFSYGGANVAGGFGLGLNVGNYTYSAANGSLVTGSFASPALAVGVGASVSIQVGVSWSLESFFGNSASITGSLGIVGGTASLNNSGGGASGGFSGGAQIMAESSYAFPLGSPVCR